MESLEYRNDYFYFVVSQARKDGKEVLQYCSGVNLDKFMPMMRGRLGLGSNPIVSGLQLVKFDLCSLAISRGAQPRTSVNGDCAQITPDSGVWYTQPLVIENYGDMTADEIVRFCVDGFVKRIAASSLIPHALPEGLLAPYELQGHLETLCKAA